MTELAGGQSLRWTPAGGSAADPSERRHAIAAILILSLIGIVNYFDRFLVSIAASDIKKAFQISDTQLGLLTGPAFVMVYAASTVLAGRLTDTKSRRLILTAALLVWSAMTASSAWAPTFVVLVLFRAGVGIGEGGANPVTYSMISDLVPAGRRAIAIAAFHSISMLGVLLAFAGGGYLVSMFGWRVAFLAAGVPGVALAIVLVVFVPDPSRGRFDNADSAGKKSSFAEALRALGRNSAYLWLLAGASLGSFGTTGILQWLPLFFIRSHGLSVQSVGLLFGPSLALGLIFGMIVGGWAANRLHQRSAAAPMTFCMLTTFAAAPLFWVVLWSPSTTIALVATFVAAATAVLFSPAFTAAVQNLVQAHMRGMAAAGCLVGSALIAQAALPQIAGILSDLFRPRVGTDSLRYALTILITANVLAAVCFARARNAIQALSTGQYPRATSIG